MHVDLGVFHKRKLTARPLKAFERALGHRLHVESRWRYERMPPSVWKFEAYHYIDTSDPALAAYSMLIQLSQFSDWFGMSWQGYNMTATAFTDDPDEATICAFYWIPQDHVRLPRFHSSGVLLRLDDMNSKSFDAQDRYHRAARPVVGVPSLPSMRTDFMVEFTAHIICGNKQDLMNYHWPRLQESKWPDGVTDVEVDARTHLGKPNIIRVKKVLRGILEQDAVAYCLSFAPSFRIRLDTGSNFHLVGQRQPSQNHSDGIVAFDLKRIPS
jgi:hypothetical protein